MSSHEHHGTNVADEISVNPLFAREGEETIPAGASRMARCSRTRPTR
jgi:hypothetical protein